MVNRRTTGGGASVPRRRFLVGSAAVAGGLAARATMAFGLLSRAPALILDARYPESLRFERIATAHGALPLQRQEDVLAQAHDVLSRHTVVAGLTTYADFTIFSEVARTRGLKLRFHAYHSPLSATRVRYRTLMSHGARTSSDKPLEAADVAPHAWEQVLVRRLLGDAQPALAGDAKDAARGPFGYTLHAWRLDL